MRRQIATVAMLAAFGVASAGSPRPLQGTAAAAQDRAPTFRAGVDLIPVDVQVVDGQGAPLTGLTADQFDVTIDGRKRRVVSSALIDYRDLATRPATVTVVNAPASSPGSPDPVATVAPVPAPRIFVLAIDVSSFEESAARPVILAATRFIDRLAPDDEVGLFSYPVGPRLDPTTDHTSVARALQGIIARRDAPPVGEFGLSASDLVELSQWTVGRTSAQAQRLIETLCGTPPDQECQQRLDIEARGSVLYYESLSRAVIGTLRSLMAGLASVPLRKTLVLISGGVISADVPGARPDSGDLGMQIGRTAAEANVSVYSLFVDNVARRDNAAETRRARNSVADFTRDSELHARWLDQFAGTAGGLMLKITMDDGTAAFDRVLKESSAYYLLGVEPVAQDRDGRTHELKVRVKEQGRGTVVRGRAWVLVPKAGATAVRAAGDAGSPPSMSGPTPPPAPIRVAQPLSPALRELAAAFDRDDRAAMVRALSGPDGATLVRTLRDSESPWPVNLRRTAAFALDVAITGLRTSSPFTRDESVRLLVEAAVRVSPAASGDAFECTWWRVATAGLEGLREPAAASVMIERAALRCPDDPRARLAIGVVRDQVLVQGDTAIPARHDPRPAPTEGEQRVLDAYATAAGSAATVHEANIRAAHLHARAGRTREGLELLGRLTSPAADVQVRYFGDIVRGQLLAASGDLDGAVSALRAALATWPGAQAARVALMTVLLRRGDVDEAGTLAEAAQTAGADQTDPWWLYWAGDYRSYSSLRAQLREVAR